MAADPRVERIAEATGDEESTILRRGLESYLERERREATIRIEELREKYGVDRPEAVEDRLRNGEIDEHPAWEEVIEWENLNARMKTLRHLSKTIDE